MDGFELNKVAAAILIAGITAMLVGNVADILYQPDKDFKRGYTIDAIAKTHINLPESKEEEIDISKLMANADAERGKKDIKKCSLCHTFNKDEPNKIGPNLWNVINTPKAHRKDFRYSSAMISKGGSWNEADLFNFLYKPRKFIPGTKMAFPGYKKPQDAADTIAYLKSLSK